MVVGFVMEMDKLYSVKETLKALCISRTNLYGLVKDGKLKPLKLGKRTLFPETELNRFIEDLKDKKV
jgi:excisionase family DNA binding protein